MVVPLAAALLVLGALLPQFTRDYLYAYAEDSSAPAGSPYMAFLAAVGRPSDIVETSYLWSTALFSGHRTADSAYNTPLCDADEMTRALHDDDAAFLLSAALNQPEIPDGSCLLPALADHPGLVQLYTSPPGLATVFELVGAGTPHPDLGDLVAGVPATAAGGTVVDVSDPGPIPGFVAAPAETTPAVGGQASLTWSWGPAHPVSQVSLGFARGEPGTTTSVSVALLGPDGAWHTVASAPGAVGAEDRTRFLLVTFPTATTASAVRVTVAALGLVAVRDLHVLGGRP
jgi:hypothetical protein